MGMTLNGVFLGIFGFCFMLSQGRTSTELYFKVNGVTSRNASTNHVTSNPENFYLDCFHVVYLHPRLFEIDSLGTKTQISSKTRNGYIRYEIPSSERNYKHTFCCSDDANNVHIEITLDYGSTEFQGLNPLVYTISAVILLGTLAIVAIVTCWIRARRSFGVSTVRGNNTPQDYLNYINDEEFTPLTQSEFAASLDERPPSYLESEKLEQTAKVEQTASSTDSVVEEQTPTATVNRVVLQARLPALTSQLGREAHMTEPTNRETTLPTTASIRNTH